MARLKDDDTLEPILPKHPPTAADPVLAPHDGPAEVASGTGSSSSRTRPPWDRLVLVGCAVVATLALVVCAMRLSSIADDQRLQACQVRVYAEEQIDGGRDRSTLRERFAECIGVGIEDDGVDVDGASDD